MCAQTHAHAYRIYTCTHAHPAPHTSVLMSFSSGEDKSKGASPSSQKNQLLLHELLRCLPSVSLQKKKSHCSMFPPAAHSLLLPCDIMTWRHKFLHRKVFILLITCNAVFEYLFLLSSVSCIYAHTHFSHIATVILLPALSWGGAAASKKNHFVAKILIFPLLPSAVLMYWCSETESRLLHWTARHH